MNCPRETLVTEIYPHPTLHPISLRLNSASASGHEGLKDAADELYYALTVEWDQKDIDFKNAQIEKG